MAETVTTCDALIEGLERDAKRYRWIREHGAWETEAFMMGLTPEQYDEALDKAMAEGTVR